MKKEKIKISEDYVDLCTETIAEFGAVRKMSFLRFVEVTMNLSTYAAWQVIENMERRGDVIVGRYGDTQILKVDGNFRTTINELDAFDVFLCVYEQEKELKEKAVTFVNKANFPIDYVLYVSSGKIYNVFIYDAQIGQKIGMFEKRYKPDDNQLFLIVFPMGTNLEKAEIPRIKGSYRLAIVRKTNGGSSVCQISEIQKNAS